MAKVLNAASLVTIEQEMESLEEVLEESGFTVVGVSVRVEIDDRHYEVTRDMYEVLTSKRL